MNEIAFALLFSLLLPAVAAAQPAEEPRADVSLAEARARDLFERASQALQSGRAAEGRDLLRQSLSILPTVPARYNLGVALNRTGEVTEAVAVLEGLLASGVPDADRQRIQTQLDAAREDVATLVVRFHGAPRARIEIDGLPVGETAERDPIRVSVDPGRHVVTAIARGSTRREVDIGRAATEEITLTLVGTSDLDETDEGGAGAWPWIAGIAGATAIAAGVVTALILLNRQGELVVDDVTGIRETLSW